MTELFGRRIAYWVGLWKTWQPMDDLRASNRSTVFESPTIDTLRAPDRLTPPQPACRRGCPPVTRHHDHASPASRYRGRCTRTGPNPRCCRASRSGL